MNKKLRTPEFDPLEESKIKIKRKPIQVRVPENLKKQIEETAYEDELSLTELFREMFKAYLIFRNAKKEKKEIVLLPEGFEKKPGEIKTIEKLKFL